MTIDDVINAIAADTETRWRTITAYGLIRSKSPHACPICWMGTKIGVNPTGIAVLYEEIAKRLDLSSNEAKLIVEAADNSPHWFSRETIQQARNRLLAACRLLNPNGTVPR